MMLARLYRHETVPRVVAITRTAAPNNAVLLPEVYTHMKKPEAPSDAVTSELLLYLNAAVTYVEAMARVSLFDQTWTAVFDSLPATDYVQLYNGPVKSVTTFTTYDEANNADTTFTGYVVDTLSGRILLNAGISWPTALRARSSVAIAYVTGHGASAATIPANLKEAVFLLVGHWSANRDLTCAVNAEMAHGVRALLGASRNLHL